jgi:mannose/fructose-specific phosphotransferase system component IIA
MNCNSPWIFLLTHGRAGEEILRSSEMITGRISDVYAFSLLPDMSPEVYVKSIREKLNEAPPGSIVLTDLFGGTPSNVAISLSTEFEIFVISGLNIAMLIDGIFTRENMVGLELAKHIQQTGVDSCKLFESSNFTIK